MIPRRVLILDTETTGLDPAVDHVIEIGAILWSVEHRTTLACWSTILRHDSNAAEAINAIPVSSLAEGTLPDKAARIVTSMAEQADVLVAHNAAFDSSFLPYLTKPWACTKRDVAWPRSGTGGKLIEIALAHGLGLSHAHRALTDCMTIARLFERVSELGHDVGAMLERGMRPKSRYIAEVSYDDRELAKAQGFSWDGKAKTWERTLADDDAIKLPFPVRRAS